MSEQTDHARPNESGWAPLPVALKVLSVLLVLWLLGSLMNLPNLYANGMPLFGTFVHGIPATFLPLLLDVVGPVVFLFALWTRKRWAANWAIAYNGIFILNNPIALFTVREILGLPQILIPTIISILFVGVVFWQRSYFNHTLQPSLTR